MNVPTMDTVVAKLDQEGALFTLDEVKVLTREIERMESQLQATRRRAEAAEEDWQAAEAELAKFHECNGEHVSGKRCWHDVVHCLNHEEPVWHKDGT
ncbi:MAG: hypothetical protein ACYCU8_05945 [Ferrimicrobium acidiphilum]